MVATEPCDKMVHDWHRRWGCGHRSVPPLSCHIRNDQKGPRRTVTAEESETHLRQGLLRPRSRRVETNTVLGLHLCDMRNEHARKIEFPDQVLDGSAGKVHAGYWLCSVIGAEVHGSEPSPSTSSFSPCAPRILSERTRNFSLPSIN